LKGSGEGLCWGGRKTTAEKKVIFRKTHARDRKKRREGLNLERSRDPDQKDFLDEVMKEEDKKGLREPDLR